MIINGDWKNKVRAMKKSGDHEGAKRELRKAKMMCYDMIKRDKDKFFIDYCLAHYAYKESNFEMANKYLVEIEKIFEKDLRKIDELSREYCNYLWLRVDINHKDMAINNIVKDMTKVYEYYMSIEKKDIAISALINIFYFKGSKERILESLRELLQCDKISDWNFVESILAGCEEISHSLYIKALELVNEYNIKINIDVV